jgi:hypothetical protein
MGWSDGEVRRLRQVIAELETRNAMLVDQNLQLSKQHRPTNVGFGAECDEPPPGAVVTTIEAKTEER